MNERPIVLKILSPSLYYSYIASEVPLTQTRLRPQSVRRRGIDEIFLFVWNS